MKFRHVKADFHGNIQIAGFAVVVSSPEGRNFDKKLKHTLLRHNLLGGNYAFQMHNV
jgi:hypothetical protein